MGLSLVMYSAYLHVNIPQSLPFICCGISCKTKPWIRHRDRTTSAGQTIAVSWGTVCVCVCLCLNAHVCFFTVQGPVRSVQMPPPFVFTLLLQVFPMEDSMVIRLMLNLLFKTSHLFSIIFNKSLNSKWYRSWQGKWRRERQGNSQQYSARFVVVSTHGIKIQDDPFPEIYHLRGVHTHKEN